MRVCVDAGHGGRDSGAVATDGTREKDLVLLYARTLREELSRRGLAVMMTRTDDTFVKLGDRADKANIWGADCFISIHANASLNPSANGAWIVHDDDTVLGISLSQEIFRQIAAIPGAVDADPAVEVYPDNSPWVGNRELAVLGETKSPAALVELGFLTNPGDLKDMKSLGFTSLICSAIADGVEAWGYDRGLLKPKPPEVELVEGPEAEEKIHYPHPAVRWQKPVAEAAPPEQNSGLFSVNTLKGFAESPTARDFLGSVKLAVVRAVLAWLEDALRDYLKLPKEV